MNTINRGIADSLIKSKEGKIDSALSDKYGLQIYLLNDRSLIAVENDKFAEFHDIGELDSFLSKYQRQVHVLYNQNPYNSDFPSYTQNLIDSLLTFLNLPKESRKPDRALIYSVNNRFVTKVDSKELKEKFLLHIIALVGEVIIHERRAKWEMHLSQNDHVTWSPDLNYKGHTIALDVYVFEALFDHPSVKDPITFSYSTINDIIDLSIEKYFIRK